MNGWEATVQAGQLQCDQTAFERYKDELYDRAVDELGIDRVRLEVRSGSENPRDAYGEYRSGGISFEEWKSTWYDVVNDDADPRRIEPSGFHFGELDRSIETVVLPLRERLAARGEELFVNLTYVGFKAGQGNIHRASGEEYAEFVLATFRHIDEKYGFAPGAVELVLEPDNAGWTGSEVGRALAATGRLLDANGFAPEFIGPSNLNMKLAAQFFDEMVAVPGALAYLDELSYHRYRGTGEEALAALVERAERHGVRMAMLEHIGADYHELHEDLTAGRNSAWSQYALAFCRAGDRGGLYYTIDDRDPVNPQITAGRRTPFLAQYFRHVRRGAVRVGAVTGDDGFSPVAFRNGDGRFTVVVKARSAGGIAVTGLPAGSYGISYTTERESGVELPQVMIGQEDTLRARMPGAGVLTVYGRSLR